MITKFKSNAEFQKKLKEDEHFRTQLLNNPNDVEIEIDHPLTWDKWIYRIVVISLGTSVLSVIIGALIWAYLEGGEREIPDTALAIGTTAVGALAGLLAPSPLNNNNENN